MKTKSLPSDLRDAQHDIDQWRQRNGRRRRIPESFWQRAVVLSRAHGVNRVAVAMRLSHARIAAMEPQQQGLATVPQPQNREVHFVELGRPTTAHLGMATGALALDLANGSSRRVRVTSADAHSAAHIVAAFFGEGVS